MNIYQVRDWDQHFENDRSRSRRSCSFVCVPNKQHGMAFCRIMNEPDGAAIYGVWCLILGACSQQPAPRNGWLTNNGEQPVITRGVGGDYMVRAWGSHDLAMKLRRPEVEIGRALEILSSEEIGWLIRYEPADLQELILSHRAVTAQSPSTTLEGIERIEGRGKGKNPPSSGASTAEKISWEKELGRISDELKKLEGSYDDHRSMSQVDRNRRAELRERKTDLLALLGMKA